MDTVRLLIIVTINLLSVEGTRNISRNEGATDVIFPCLLNPIHAAISFWKINDTIFYFSDVPLPFISENGRDIKIPTVDLSLNGTSFQCFIPSSSGIDLLSSPIRILVVREDGNSQNLTNHQNDQQAKLALNHQRFFFTPVSLILAWKILKNTAQHYDQYQLIVESSCHSNNKILINNTKDESISFQPEDLLDEKNDSILLNLTSFDEENSLFLTLETFRLDTEIITKDIYICLANRSEPTTSVPSCISIPPVSGRRTLVLAIPFQLINSSVMQDLLCPVQPHAGERCVDLLKCNRFSESVFAKSITICRTTTFNDDSSLEMCFHNITEAMYGTKIHFFYSDLLQQCDSRSRMYIGSFQLITDSIPVYLPATISRTIYNNTVICFESNSSCYQDNKTVFSVSVKDIFGCVVHQSNSTSDNGCISFNVIPMNMACVSSYHLEVKVYSKIVYSGPVLQIPGFDDALILHSSKRPCYDHSTPVTTAYQFESTQDVAVALCVFIALVIVMLLVAIVIATYKNFKQ